MDEAGGVGCGEDFCAEVEEFFDAVEGDVPGSGDDGGLAFDVVSGVVEHVLHEVDGSVAGGFFADEAAAEGEAFSGEDAGEAVFEAFVGAEEVADFTGADVDVSGGDVDVFSDVAV